MRSDYFPIFDYQGLKLLTILQTQVPQIYADQNYPLHHSHKQHLYPVHLTLKVDKMNSMGRIFSSTIYKKVIEQLH